MTQPSENLTRGERINEAIAAYPLAAEDSTLRRTFYRWSAGHGLLPF